MRAIAGEGVELPVSTEHNLRIDFETSAQAAGVRPYFTPIIGSEVTTSAGLQCLAAAGDRDGDRSASRGLGRPSSGHRCRC
jgi:hypothetical protein